MVRAPAELPGCTCAEGIELVPLEGAVPVAGAYRAARRIGPTTPRGQVVLQNSYTAFPAVLDAHLFYDARDDRLWMTWGGWSIFLTELDPATGLLKDAALRSAPELRDHPAGTHTEILSWAPNAAYGGQGGVPEGWEGDALSASGAYMEGPALFRHAESGAWFALGSYGWLVEDYTIRVCKRVASDPRGAFLDKDGLPCTVFDAARNRYGASVLVAQEGNHTVPGHPHVWREGDAHYLGYDYRPYSCTIRKNTQSESDEGAYCDPAVAGQAARGEVRRDVPAGRRPAQLGARVVRGR